MPAQNLSWEEDLMRRCISLALLGAGRVAPNPMVGSVLVHGERIIGEGYHHHYGGPHAEVFCIASVAEADISLIPDSTLYVSLEPCAHFGKTPPCADLIIRHRIPRVVIGCRDPFAEVNGRGIERLRQAGVDVRVGMLEQQCIDLNKRFFTFHRHRRPYMILKWAQTADGIIGSLPGEPRLFISSPATNRLVHRWRSEEAAILVGAQTARDDNPSLDDRHWGGPQPLRITIDRDRSLPSDLHLFDQTHPTLVYNGVDDDTSGQLEYKRIDWTQPVFPQIMDDLYRRGILSVLVEGGAATLGSLSAAGLWDQARVIRNSSMMAGAGIPAPRLPAATLASEQTIFTDLVQTYIPNT